MVTNREDLLKELNRPTTSKILSARIFYGLDVKNDNISFLNDIIDCIDVIKKKYDKITLSIPYEKIPMKYFGKMYDFYKKVGMPCSVAVDYTFYMDYDIHESTKYWDIETIINANRSINQVCQIIKDNNLSPCEALAFIHHYVATVTDYKATQATRRSWSDDDQFFLGAYSQNKEFVCAGYSALEKEIIDTLNMPGLSCEIIAVELLNKDKNEVLNHARNFITIKDKKYKINQSCFDDATWDNNKYAKTTGFAHFMMNRLCHEKELNDKYTYFWPETIEYSKFRTEKSFGRFSDKWLYNKGQELTQETIEKIYFTMLAKTKHYDSLVDIKTDFASMLKESYKEQTERRYNGYIKQEQIMTPYKELARIFLDASKEKNRSIDDEYNL